VSAAGYNESRRIFELSRSSLNTIASATILLYPIHPAGNMPALVCWYWP